MTVLSVIGKEGIAGLEKGMTEGSERVTVKGVGHADAGELKRRAFACKNRFDQIRRQSLRLQIHGFKVIDFDVIRIKGCCQTCRVFQTGNAASCIVGCKRQAQKISVAAVGKLCVGGLLRGGLDQLSGVSDIRRETAAVPCFERP